ncbi:MAG TPA: symmetrical bis(5'-nucleosyl)-tetraphosphatase, partial [Gammaproteobacteria bacterium]
AGCLLVHGGLPPQWDLDTALEAAREVENALRGGNYRALLRDMYGNEPARWSEHLTGMDRARYIINAFTRIRYCTVDGRLDFTQKGPPGSQPPELLPWFTVPGRRSAELDVLFGHWSTLRDSKTPHALALDTGCLWGGKLTALRIDGSPRTWTSVSCGKSAGH